LVHHVTERHQVSHPLDQCWIWQSHLQTFLFKKFSLCVLLLSIEDWNLFNKIFLMFFVNFSQICKPILTPISPQNTFLLSLSKVLNEGTHHGVARDNDKDFFIAMFFFQSWHHFLQTHSLLFKTTPLVLFLYPPPLLASSMIYFL
jgi:hypothetical protein